MDYSHSNQSLFPQPNLSNSSIFHLPPCFYCPYLQSCYRVFPDSWWFPVLPFWDAPTMPWLSHKSSCLSDGEHHTTFCLNYQPLIWAWLRSSAVISSYRSVSLSCDEFTTRSHLLGFNLIGTLVYLFRIPFFRSSSDCCSFIGSTLKSSARCSWFWISGLILKLWRFCWECRLIGRWVSLSCS